MCIRDSSYCNSITNINNQSDSNGMIQMMQLLLEQQKQMYNDNNKNFNVQNSKFDKLSSDVTLIHGC